MVFNEITVLAPGLLGASLLAAVRQRFPAIRLNVWARREATRNACLDQPWCDAVFSDPGEAVRTADLVVLCAPVDVIPQLAASIAPALRPGTLVTDVGSTKTRLSTECVQALPEHSVFIGSHPMAGSEKQGLEYADADLFENRPCFVTPFEETPVASLSQLIDFWESLGMLVYESSVEEHDRIVASISHLPHLLAAALCAHVAEQPKNWQSLAGQGLKDTTRIAAGSASLWRSIFAHNQVALLEALSQYESHLATFKSALETGDFDRVEKLLDTARQCRSAL